MRYFFILLMIASNNLLATCVNDLTRIYVDNTAISHFSKTTHTDKQYAKNLKLKNDHSSKFLLNANSFADDKLKNAAINYLNYLINDIGVEFTGRNINEELSVIGLFGKAILLENELLNGDNFNWVNETNYRPPLKEISLKEMRSSKPHEISKDELKKFAKLLETSLEDDLLKNFDQNSSLKELILKKLKDLWVIMFKYNPNNIMAGLKEVLSSNYKELPKGTLDIITHFRTYLPIEIGKAFNAEKVGLKTRKRDEILTILEDIFLAQSKFRNLFLTYYYLSSSDSLNLEESKKAISLLKFNQKIFEEYFTDGKDKIKMILESFLESSLQVYTDIQIDRTIDRIIMPIIKTVSKTEVDIYNQVKLEKLKLREVPPWVAIVKGFVGGDCSSHQDWLFPYNYTDRVFFIYKDDETNDILGYLHGTLIEISGKKTFLIHTINGPGVGGFRTKLILNAFLNHPELVEAEQTVLGDNPEDYINFEEIILAWKDIILVSNGEKINTNQEKIVFYDHDIRGKIEYLYHLRKYGNGTFESLFDSMNKLNSIVVKLNKIPEKFVTVRAKDGTININLENSPNRFLVDTSSFGFLYEIDPSWNMLLDAYEDRADKFFEDFAAYSDNIDNDVIINDLLQMAITKFNYQKGLHPSLLVRSYIDPRPIDFTILNTMDGYNTFFSILEDGFSMTREANVRIAELLNAAIRFGYTGDIPIQMLLQSGVSARPQDLTILTDVKKRNVFFEVLLEGLKKSDEDIILNGIKFLKYAITLGYKAIIPPVLFHLDLDLDISNMDTNFFKNEKWNQIFIEKLRSSKSIDRITKTIEIGRNFDLFSDGIPLFLLITSNVKIQMQDFIRCKYITWNDLYQELELGIIKRLEISKGSKETIEERLSEILKGLLLFADRPVIPIYSVINSDSDLKKINYIINRIGHDTFFEFFKLYTRSKID